MFYTGYRQSCDADESIDSMLKCLNGKCTHTHTHAHSHTMRSIGRQNDYGAHSRHWRSEGTKGAVGIEGIRISPRYRQGMATAKYYLSEVKLCSPELPKKSHKWSLQLSREKCVFPCHRQSITNALLAYYRLIAFPAKTTWLTPESVIINWSW